jgi:hypothetical protein
MTASLNQQKQDAQVAGYPGFEPDELTKDEVAAYFRVTDVRLHRSGSCQA